MRVWVRAKGLRRGWRFLWVGLLLSGCAPEGALSATAAAAPAQVDAAAWAALIEKHPTRLPFGTDSGAPSNWDAYARTHVVYRPLREQLDADAKTRVERRNYERIFDAAVPGVRAWEQLQVANRYR